MIKKYCSRCTRRYEGDRCQDCTRERWRKEKQYASKENAKFYNSMTWRKARKAYIRENPLCEKCSGRTVPGYYVDHIVPIRLGGDELDWVNLQTLCKNCHNKKTGKEAHVR